MNYVSQDRRGLAVVACELAKTMAEPKEGDEALVRTCLRYIRGSPGCPIASLQDWRRHGRAVDGQRSGQLPVYAATPVRRGAAVRRRDGEALVPRSGQYGGDFWGGGGAVGASETLGANYTTWMPPCVTRCW